MGQNFNARDCKYYYIEEFVHLSWFRSSKFPVFYFIFFFQSLMVGFDFLDVHHYEDAFIT